MTNTAENNDLMTETLFFEDMRILQSLCGEHDRHLKSIAKRLDVKVRVRGNEIELYGKEPGLAPAKQLLRELYFIIESGYPLNHVDMVHAIKMIAENPGIQLKDIFLDTVVLTHNKKPITPKSFTQKKYVDAIRNYDIVFGIGPAGTGKTYLAM
ncbi:MAG: phosphate starvation-inducible protein PhoH, partial [Deltaproteobacteria bacterium]|nr:phosphate starvation-inducible protein PhoH [Deltaproteobacteria bacterium]